MTEYGRPTEYSEEYAEQAEKLCLLGATDEEIADFFGVSVRTIHRWKLKHEDFCHSVKTGKSVCDARVERSLYQRASGYRFTEEHAFKVRQADGGEDVKVVEVEREAPPSDTAIIFWLKNRKPDEWRDRREVTGEGGGPLEVLIRKFSDDADHPSE